MNDADVALRKAIEETINVNLQRIVDYSKDTRQMVRKLEQTMGEFKNMILSKQEEVNLLKQQVALLQADKVKDGRY